MTLAAERRAARERALGLLYEAEAKGTTGAEVLAGLPVEADDFAVALVLAVDEHRARIDDLLEGFAQGWTLARMPALDRAALRMGSAELMARPDVPTGVVLAETVDLASRFSTDASGRFVNGLLARIAVEVRGPAEPLSAEDTEDDRPPPDVDGLVIDLDGVIRHWDPDYHASVEGRFQLPAGSLAAAALAEERLDRVTDGRLAFDDWCHEVGAELAAAHGGDAAALAEAWAAATWHIDLRVVELIDAVREQVPVALLSNASSNLRTDLESSGILDLFDAVVGSAELGAAKPAEHAFRTAADRIGVPLERCLFIDDTAIHVEAALALGMRAERFTGADELRELLVALGLLP